MNLKEAVEELRKHNEYIKDAKNSKLSHALDFVISYCDMLMMTFPPKYDEQELARMEEIEKQDMITKILSNRR